MTDAPHLHTFSEPLGDPERPYARRCRDCGEPQQYRNPPSGGVVFSDVLIDKDDLRELIGAYRAQAAMPDESAEELCDRLELLLDAAQ